MKRILPLLSCSLVTTLLLIPATLLFAEPEGKAIRATELKKWVDYHETLESMSANFTQTRKLLTVKHPLVAEGQLIFQAPNRFRWQLGEPAKTVVVHNGKTVTILDVDSKKAQVIAPSEDDQSPGSYLNFAFPSNWEEFQETFRFLDYDVTENILTVKVMPRDEKLAEEVRWMTFVVDTTSNELKEFSSSLKIGSSILIEFQDFTPNPDLAEDAFEVSLEGYLMEP